jgi:hypothetical protein
VSPPIKVPAPVGGVVLVGRTTRRDERRRAAAGKAPPGAPVAHGGRQARIAELLVDPHTVNFTMDIALSEADVNAVRAVVDHPTYPARHALEASLRGMLASRLVERDTGLQVIAKNLHIVSMEMRRRVHSEKKSKPSVLHVRVAILAPLVKAGLLGKDSLAALGKRIGKKLLEDAFQVAGTRVRISNYYVGL